MKALIIGGGIAGTTLALALHKAGIDSEIFEARDRHSDGVGAFITLAVNGVRALEVLGVDIADVRGIDTPAMQIALGDGRQLARFPLGPTLDDGTVSRSVLRGDLYRVLRTRVEAAGIPVHYSRALVGSQRDASGVTARFADGTTASADLLIGADGLHSRTRALIDPRAPKPRYLGVLNAGGYAEGLDLDDERGVMHMVFGARTFFSYLIGPDGEIWWFANPPQRTEPARGELAAAPTEEWRATLRELVAPDVGPATAIIDASPTLFAPWPTHDFPNVPHWHRDRMIIIGDAAHAASPSSGQGASMAIEDALELAIALRDAPDIEAAFTRYESRRRPRVTRVVRQGKRNGNGKTPGRFGRTIRDFFLSRMFAKPPKSQDADGWLYRYTIDWDGVPAA